MVPIGIILLFAVSFLIGLKKSDFSNRNLLGSIWGISGQALILFFGGTFSSCTRVLGKFSLKKIEMPDHDENQRSMRRGLLSFSNAMSDVS